MRFIILLLIFCSCKNFNKEDKNVIGIKEESLPESVDSIKFYSQYFRDTLRFYKEEMKYLRANFPTLCMDKMDSVMSPQDAYRNRKGRDTIWKNESGKEHVIQFNTDLGKDVFYALHQYFLQIQNGSIYANGRNELIDILNNIHLAKSSFGEHSTWKWHVYRQIPAFVEYEIYLKKKRKDNSENLKYESGLNEMQKKQLIKKIRLDSYSLINDYKDVYSEATKEEISMLKANVEHGLIELEKLINSQFLLQSAIKFDDLYYESNY